MTIIVMGRADMDCPVCGNEHYKYNRYYDEYWGGIYVCEEHGYCERCGYVVD
jgi:C4-type Zn-finger protein